MKEKKVPKIHAKFPDPGYPWDFLDDTTRIYLLYIHSIPAHPYRLQQAMVSFSSRLNGSSCLECNDVALQEES